MGDYNSIRTNHDFMSFSIYNFLDNLLAAVRPSDTLENESQNRDQITTQVKPGGYSEDIFIFLSDREKEEYNCSVCYSVVKDAHQCRNGHKFCYSCIYVWSTCNRSGADCCPACRCDGVYARNDQLNEKIGRKRVKCVFEGCNWRGFLRDFNDHEHRIYDFRELNSSIELPFLKDKDSSFAGSVDLKKSEIIEVTKIDTETSSHSNGNGIIDESNLIKNDEETNTNSSLTGRVSRTNIAPRRLSRGSENTLLSGRSSMLRPTLSNYPRNANISTRCPTYRNSINMTRLSRLPRNPTINVDNISGSDTTNSVLIDEISRQPAHSEYTQTNFLESSNNSPFETSSAFSTESPQRIDNIDLSRRGVSGNVRRTNLLPAINSNNTNNVSSERQLMEYRRLAPTYASRRGANFGAGPNEGREQLAMMLILLTSDLEDRVTLSDQSHEQQTTTTNSHIQQQQQSSENSGSINESVSSSSSRTSVRLGRSRLQEFRNLNRRLSEVANSLDRLIASTSRETDHRHTAFSTATPESSTSNATSDADEEFNSNSNNNNNNSFYR